MAMAVAVAAGPMKVMGRTWDCRWVKVWGKEEEEWRIRVRKCLLLLRLLPQQQQQRGQLRRRKQGGQAPGQPARQQGRRQGQRLRLANQLLKRVRVCPQSQRGQAILSPDLLSLQALPVLRCLVLPLPHTMLLLLLMLMLVVTPQVLSAMLLGTMA